MSITAHYKGGDSCSGEPHELPKGDVLLVVLESGRMLGGTEYLIYDPTLDVWIDTDSDRCADRHEALGHPVFHGVTVTDREWRALMEKLNGKR